MGSEGGRRGTSGHKVQLTVSGNSMMAPQNLVASDSRALERPPSKFFDELFMTVDNLNRVHCTRESNPKKHLYLGGKNGMGMAIADADWDGDAEFMREVLDRFRQETVAKITEAKTKGWEFQPPDPRSRQAPASLASRASTSTLSAAGSRSPNRA